MGTREGFAIYNCEPFGKCFQEQIGGIGIAEMLYCTSLVALVGAGEQVTSQPEALQFGIANSLGCLYCSLLSLRDACVCGTPRLGLRSAT